MARTEECAARGKESEMALAGILWYATCAEPGGSKFGVIAADTDAICGSFDRHPSSARTRRWWGMDEERSFAEGTSNFRRGPPSGS
jgi:hypothetical protein